MKPIHWASAYEPIPPALEYRVEHTLAQLEDSPGAARRLSLRTAILVAALLVAFSGIAYAIFGSQTAEWFGWFYGPNWKQELENGEYAAMGQSHRLGDVTYTVEEMVYKTEGEMTGLYGVVRIAPAEGANVVLLPEDLNVNDPAGFLLHYANADQTITDEDPSYAEIARQRGAKLLVVRAGVRSLQTDGVEYVGSVGESWLPQPDGTLLGTLELNDGLPHADHYDLTLALACREAAMNGRPLEDGVWLQEDWAVEVVTKGEGK